MTAIQAIEIQGLRKKYGSFEALKGIDLEVHTGEIFGFLGPNGAGKSTTIRILLDEIRATAGTARLLGLDSRRDAVAIHRRLGYLPSDLALYPTMTGAQTLRFFARLRGEGASTGVTSKCSGSDLTPTWINASGSYRQVIGRRWG